MGEHWAISVDDEHYESEKYSTKEEAVAAWADHDVERGSTFSVALCRDWVFEVDGEAVLERLHDQAYEDVGEAAEYWPNILGIGFALLPKGDPEREKRKAAIPDLSARLTTVLKAWLVEQDDASRFWTVDTRTTEDYLVPEEDGAAPVRLTREQFLARRA